jgi:hypothetical protein
MVSTEINTQTGPYPADLYSMVMLLLYKPKWTFRLEHLDRGQGSVGLTLVITITTQDSYHPERLRSVAHYFIVPAAGYDMRSWRAWLFDQILLVEKHEAAEFFTLAGQKPYAPSHGPGSDPYLIRELGTEIDQRTSYLGVLNPEKE